MSSQLGMVVRPRRGRVCGTPSTWPDSSIGPCAAPELERVPERLLGRFLGAACSGPGAGSDVGPGFGASGSFSGNRPRVTGAEAARPFAGRLAHGSATPSSTTYIARVTGNDALPV